MNEKKAFLSGEKKISEAVIEGECNKAMVEMTKFAAKMDIWPPIVSMI